ncbi:MAG: VWA domain-containing protein, partial [Deltaproteobacteria bacterium]|nr:VWA domain-containing protein [Deltaproteobacteria bacterium]
MNDRSIGYVILVSMVVRAVAVALLCAAALLFLAQAASAVELSVQTEDGRAIDRASVPLFFEQVEVDIHDQVAAARHWFHFRNDLAEDVEVTCRFALGPGELVEGFSYYNGDERIVGEVLEKQAAEEVYQELTQIRRQDPGLLEQDRDRFRFRVYPVQPGEVKPVEVTSIRPLAGREGWVEYVVPRENLPDGAAVFSLRVDITDDLPVREVGTAGFQGTVTQFGPRHWRVEFEAESVIWSGDLKIRYRLAADDYSLRFLATRPDETDGTFLLLVSPRDGVEAAEVIGRDIVFVVDISGSMSGPPLEQTRAALLHIIGQLHPDDRFDVVAFDDDQYPLFGSLRMADGPSRDEAVRRVRALETKGGTNILGALGRALDELEAVVAHRPRAIVFLTDGQGNEPPATVLAEVRRRDSGIRVFSFGVGEGVHRDFLERLARENRGLCALVQDSRTLEAEIRRLYDRMAMPLMVDLDVRFEGMQVHSVYPGRLPDLYRDSEVVLMGRYSQAGAGKVRVTG